MTPKNTGRLPVANPVTSFWNDEPKKLDDYRSTAELPSSADIIIIGSGLSGVATAYFLLKDHPGPNPPSIVLLEARKICNGATGRNGGHVKPDTYSDIPKFAKLFGIETAAQLAAFEASHVPAVKDLVESEGLDCDFHVTRALDVYLDPTHAKKIEETYREIARAGIVNLSDVAFTPKKHAERVSGVKNAQGCISYTAAHLWPSKLVHQLLEKLVDQGINVQAHTPVTSISQSEGDAWSVNTPRGTIQAKKIIHATNAYASHILPEYEHAITPVRGVCSHLESDKEKTPHLVNTYGIRFDEVNNDYLIPRPDGSIIVGGAREAFWHDRKRYYDTVNDDELVDEANSYFDDYMQRYFRGWEDSGMKTKKVWTGILGYSFDFMPHIGEVPGRPGQFIIAGFTGYGMPKILLSSKGLAKMRANIPCAGYPRAELRWRSFNKAKPAGRKTKSKTRSDTRDHAPSPQQESWAVLQQEDFSNGLLAGTGSSPSDDSVASIETIQTTFQSHFQETSEPPADVSSIMSALDFPLDLDFFDSGDSNTRFDQEDGLDKQGAAENEDAIKPFSGCLLPFLWTSQDDSSRSPRPTPGFSWAPALDQLRPSYSATRTLMMRFDQKTCDILSINEGSNGNPWRTLISSLADHSPAVCHALCCMAAFHGSYDLPSLHSRGIEEMEESSKWLTTEREVRFIPSLAASIALVFAEGWKSPKNTSNKHLGNTRKLIVERFPTEQRLWHLTTEDSARFKYLVTAFVYVHVIAGITYRKEEHAHPLPENILTFLSPVLSGSMTEIDPLLGCATLLFPLVDRVALLVNKVRRAKNNSLTIVSQAGELHEQLLQWQAPKANLLQSFGEHRYSPQHPVQTAEALRYATLLHLHQAVPEIPSLTSEDLARKVLLKLASIPPTSRITNLHIFPLLAASCELTDEEDREWAKQRWEAMILRLRVGNADTCWEIVQATWARRDQYASERRSSVMEQESEIGEDFTIRGKLHWLNVMDDQQWQVFVG
ncbi:hypothetical protein FOYG_09030 [Fusarium oxysporum NRRL 32931]|uniref:FAD dependent oxidoreductase domain-containing protein n=1 Tax=Fusarium oxysporum NRRL 32931 TaxID=660029 RepID=W9IH20_FUSOX|nr:hypothetical protein FOYG_09030 [Fusarium oxysporum NRRL 32931]